MLCSAQSFFNPHYKVFKPHFNAFNIQHCNASPTQENVFMLAKYSISADKDYFPSLCGIDPEQNMDNDENLSLDLIKIT